MGAVLKVFSSRARVAEKSLHLAKHSWLGHWASVSAASNCGGEGSNIYGPKACPSWRDNRGACQILTVSSLKALSELTDESLSLPNIYDSIPQSLVREYRLWWQNFGLLEPIYFSFISPIFLAHQTCRFHSSLKNSHHLRPPRSTLSISHV